MGRPRFRQDGTYREVSMILDLLQFCACQTRGVLVRLPIDSKSVGTTLTYINVKTSSLNSLTPALSGMTRYGALVLAGAMITQPAQAAFHLWNIREVYTDSSGSL